MRGEVECIEDPEWWNQDGVMAVMDHVCEKLVCYWIQVTPFLHPGSNFVSRVATPV
jgi:hypothetical protein